MSIWSNHVKSDRASASFRMCFNRCIVGSKHRVWRCISSPISFMAESCSWSGRWWVKSGIVCWISGFRNWIEMTRNEQKCIEWPRHPSESQEGLDRSMELHGTCTTWKCLSLTQNGDRANTSMLSMPPMVVRTSGTLPFQPNHLSDSNQRVWQCKYSWSKLLQELTVHYRFVQMTRLGMSQASFDIHKWRTFLDRSATSNELKIMM